MANEFLRRDDSLEPVSIHVEQLPVRGRIAARGKNESARFRRGVDRNAVIGMQVIVDGEQNVAVLGSLVEMYAEMPLLAAASRAARRADNTLAVSVLALEAHTQKRLVSDQHRAVEAPLHPAPSWAVFVEVHL